MVHIFGKRPPAPSPSPVGAPASSAGIDAAVFDVTTASFERDVLLRSAQTPVLLDCWATWCEPCKELTPRLDTLARAARGAWALAKCEIEANPDIAGLLGVQSVPTCVLFVKSRPADAFVGSIPDAQLVAFLSRHVKLDAAASSPATDAAPAAPADEETPAVLISLGRAKDALVRLRAKDDPILEIRAAVLAGDDARASRALEALPKEKADCDEALAARRLLDGHHDLSMGVEPLLDTLLTNIKENAAAQRAITDILILLGRGPVADPFRARLSKALFR